MTVYSDAYQQMKDITYNRIKQNRHNVIADNLEFNNELINLINDIIFSKSWYLGTQIPQLLYAII